MKKMLLPDINFWLALSFQSHQHHDSANTWFQLATDQSCCFCRLTQQGFLRLVTNRRIFPLDAVSMRDAWQLYDRTLSDTRVAFSEEPTDIETAWRTLTSSTLFSTNVWADAYLAAFAMSANFEIVTFDKAFVQHKKLRCTILQ